MAGVRMGVELGEKGEGDSGVSAEEGVRQLAVKGSELGVGGRSVRGAGGGRW